MDALDAKTLAGFYTMEGAHGRGEASPAAGGNKKAGRNGPLS